MDLLGYSFVHSRHKFVGSLGILDIQVIGLPAWRWFREHFQEKARLSNPSRTFEQDALVIQDIPDSANNHVTTNKIGWRFNGE
jgi:hypothetical protein